MTKRGLLKSIAGGGAAAAVSVALPQEANAFSLTSWISSLFPTYTVDAQITTFLDAAFSSTQRIITLNAGDQSFTDQAAGTFKTRLVPLSVTGPTAAFSTKSVYWKGQAAGKTLRTSNTEIYPFGDRLDGTDLGSMMDSQHAIIGSDYSLSYGFYNADLSNTILGWADGSTPAPACNSLTNAYQFYVYLTDNFSTWMGKLAQATPALRTQPFSVFVLPGAHDAGMNGLPQLGAIFSNYSRLTALINSMLDTSSVAGRQLLSLGGAALLRSLPQSTLTRVIRNLAVTQKETTATMLDLGVRYFDFRPGYIFPAGASETSLGLYHQHSVIPGGSFDTFLADILRWLVAHPTEIAVVNLNKQGFQSSAMAPTDATVSAILSSAVSRYGSGIKVGDKKSLGSSYNTLIASGTRLIVLSQMSGSNGINRYDSYSDAAYGTTCVNSIVNALNQMTKSRQSGADYTVLQLQGTATATKSGAVAAILGDGDASSPLMATKGLFDASTLSWALSNVRSRFDPQQSLVLLNDFADNATSSVAVSLTRQRSLLIA